jgi:hypothetical protein
MLMLLFAFLQPPKSDLAVFKLPGEVVQLFPSYSSVAPCSRMDYDHQNAKAAVCVPAAPKACLAVTKLLEGDQVAPLYSSVPT